jgi:FdhD protein
MRTYLRIRGTQAEEVAGEVVREQPLSVFINGEKFLTLLCSPMQLEALVVGYLWMEKVIADLDEIARVEISAVDGRAEVTLTPDGSGTLTSSSLARQPNRDRERRSHG